MRQIKKYLIIFTIIIFSANNLILSQNKIDSLSLILKTEIPDTARINILLELSADFTKSNSDTAIYFAEKALAIANKYDNITKFEIYIKLGSIYRSIIESLGRKYNIGYAYENKNAKTAVLYFKKAIQEINIDENPELYATTLYNLASSYWENGEYSNSIESFEKTIKFCKKNSFSDLIFDSYYALSSVYWKTYEFNKELEILKTCLASITDQTEKVKIRRVYSQIATNYMNKENNKEALENALIAYEISKSKTDYGPYAATCLLIGEAYLNLKEYDKSIGYLYESLDSFKELKYYSWIAVTLNYIGDYYKAIHDYSLAKDYYVQSIGLAKSISRYEIISANYFGLSEIDSTLGNHKDEYLNYAQCVLYEDSFKYQEKEIKLKEAQLKFKADKKEQELEINRKKNEIKDIAIKKNKYYMFGTTIIITLIILFLYFAIQINIITVNKKIKNLSKSNEQQKINHDFILKTLDSIKIYLSKSRDKLTSQLYLSKFAKLMRLFLDNAQNKFISLRLELDTIMLFIEIENFRLNKDISCIIDSMEFDLSDYLIPPFIIQSQIKNLIYTIEGFTFNTNEINIEINKRKNKLTCVLELYYFEKSLKKCVQTIKMKIPFKERTI